MLDPFSTVVDREFDVTETRRHSTGLSMVSRSIALTRGAAIENRTVGVFWL